MKHLTENDLQRVFTLHRNHDTDRELIPEQFLEIMSGKFEQFQIPTMVLIGEQLDEKEWFHSIDGLSEVVEYDGGSPTSVMGRIWRPYWYWNEEIKEVWKDNSSCVGVELYLVEVWKCETDLGRFIQKLEGYMLVRETDLEAGWSRYAQILKAVKFWWSEGLPPKVVETDQDEILDVWIELSGLLKFELKKYINYPQVSSTNRMMEAAIQSIVRYIWEKYRLTIEYPKFKVVFGDQNAGLDALNETAEKILSVETD